MVTNLISLSWMLQSGWRSSEAAITSVDLHAFPRVQAGFSDLNSSQGSLIAFYGEKKSIERSLCPSSTDEHGKVRGDTSYAQVREFQCPSVPNFSSTLNLGSSVEQEEIEFGGVLLNFIQSQVHVHWGRLSKFPKASISISTEFLILSFLVCEEN